MLNFTAGEACTIPVAFLVDGEYVSPDLNSVTYSLRDNTGALFVSATDIAVTLSATATEAFIAISALLNTKTLTIETRSLVVSFSVNSRPYQIRVHYRLNDWLNIAVTAEDVRNHLGLTRGELPDGEVDLYGAYYRLNDLLGGTVLSDALVSGTLTAQFANEAVIYEAALILIPSLPARMIRKQADGTTSFERFPHFEFEVLRSKLSALLDEALGQVTGDVLLTPSLLVAGSRTDPVTNA